MPEKAEVDLSDVKKLYSLMEKLNEFFHQPDHYQDAGTVYKFMEGGAYKEIAHAYYHILWNWLPQERAR